MAPRISWQGRRGVVKGGFAEPDVDKDLIVGNVLVPDKKSVD